MKEKLIRHEIPNIANSKGETLKIRFANETEMPGLLRAKLQEEVGEYLENPCEEELADILEVVEALAIRCHKGVWALRRTRENKWWERGGFNGIVLIED